MNRKIYISRKVIDTLFDSAPPYQVTAMEKPASVPGYYSAKEAAEKYDRTKSAILKLAASHHVPKRVISRGTYLYSSSHLDDLLSRNAASEDITKWYTAEEIKQRYSMSTPAVYSFVSEYAIPRKNDRGKTLYSKQDVDAHLKARLGDKSIKEWYSMEEITQKYGMQPGYIANFVFKHKIPRKRNGNKSLYSKTHFDKAVKSSRRRNEYITVAEAMETYSITRDSLYSLVKTYDIPKIQDGKYIKIQKTKLEKLLNPKLLKNYGNTNSNTPKV